MSGVTGTEVAVMAFSIGAEHASTIMEMYHVMAALLKNVIARKKLVVLNGTIGVNMECVIMEFNTLLGHVNDTMDQSVAMMRSK